MLNDPDATLFVITPNSGTVAGAAVALIDSSESAARTLGSSCRPTPT